MTAEREAMTLEQVKCWHRRYAETHTYDDAAFAFHTCCADAIDAHLSRAAEPVAKVRIFEWDGEWGWELYNDEPFQALPVGNYKLYLWPPEPARDAKDAARLDWLADRYTQASDAVDRELGLPSGMCSLREAIDAAMAQEGE